MIHVVAAAVTDAAGRILIAQRPQGKHLAGGWEFPGGKLEPGEDRAAGLTRELHEELGISIRQPRPLLRLRHTYPYGEVLIDMWVVRFYDGEPRGMDGQALRWLTQEELETAELLPADRPIVRALRLPERLTERSSRYYEVVEPDAFPRKCGEDGGWEAAPSKLRGLFCRGGGEAAEAAGAGAEFLVLREAIAAGELRALCASVAVPVYARGVGAEGAWGLGATGCNELGSPGY